VKSFSAEIQWSGKDRRSTGNVDRRAHPGKVVAADLIVSYLEQLGVQAVFGVPGGAIEPVYDALARSERRGGPRAIVARHEAGAAFMADGYARETGRLGVCIATSGPGTTNLITGVACAYENDIPILVITAQPAIHSFGKGALQESSCTGIDAIGMFRHCTRYNSLVSHADQLETKLTNALMQATHGRCGPVHLSIPVDILRGLATITGTGKGTGMVMVPPTLLQPRAELVDMASVRSLHAELAQARNPVFLIGAGSGEAIEAILGLASRTNALFVTTPDAKGFINARHRGFRGVFGFGGHASADALLRSEPDLVIAFGTGFSELSSGGFSTSVLNDRLIHVDRLEEHLMRSPMARLHVRGSILAVCTQLLALFCDDAPLRPGDAPDAPAHLCHPDVVLHASEQFDSDATPIKPQRLMKELSRRCPPNTRFLADSGNSMVWTVHYLQPNDRRGARTGVPAAPAPGRPKRSGTASWLRVLMDFAPMGWAIGAAVGVARANPACPVVCVTGDGSYLMNGQEITVAAAEGLTVVFVVLNDSALGMVMHGQRLAKAEQIGFELPKVDYRRMAQAMGIPGHVIESPEDLVALDFDAILARKGPTMLDVRVDREEAPPMMQRVKTLASVK
jgi:acetolactate synthase-1/2/3 large subunit